MTNVSADPWSPFQHILGYTTYASYAFPSDPELV
uniref:Uncharacterized protein n=1 Tax=Anguilla anguilla TaxID=7936 RepID=A0A0E9XDP6_ANGAN